MNRPGVVKTAFSLLPIYAVVRAGEALLPFLAASWFGRSLTTDVYYTELAIFQLAGSLLFSAFQDSALVPIAAGLKRDDASRLPRLFGALLTYTLTGGAALATVTAAVAIGAARASAGRAALPIATALALPFALYLPALSVRTLLGALHNAEGRFTAPSIGSFAGTIAFFASLLASRHTGIESLPWAMLISELTTIAALGAMMGMPFFRAAKLGFMCDETLRRFARLAFAEVMGGAITRVNPVVDQLMASAVGIAGGATLLRYSLDVALAPTAVLQGVLFPVLLSRYADELVRGDIAAFRATFWKSILGVGVLLAAVAFVLHWARQPLLEALFLRGQMDARAVTEMVELFPYHLIGLGPFGCLLVLSRAHVALGNSRIMVEMGVLNAVLNAALNVVLSRWLGLSGIALSTSIVQTVVALVFLFRLEAGIARAVEPASS